MPPLLGRAIGTSIQTLLNRLTIGKSKRMRIKSKEDIYKELGGKLERTDAFEYEDGIFQGAYQLFERIVNDLNKAYKDVGFSLEFALTGSFKFNAHAIKFKENEYIIAFRSGIVTKTLHTLGREIDFYKDKFESKQLVDKEAPLALGCTFIWIQMFTHELGHIIRGHNDISKDRSMINMLGPAQELCSEEILTDLSISKDELKFLIEIDADVFSSFFVAQQVIDLTKKPKDGSLISEKDILTICFSSIFFFFNWVNENQSDTTKYPPAMLRSHILFEEIIRYLDGKLNLSVSEIKAIEGEITYECYSFLEDYDSFAQDMSRQGLDKLNAFGVKAQKSYPNFASYASLNLSKIKLDFED